MYFRHTKVVTSVTSSDGFYSVENNKHSRQTHFAVTNVLIFDESLSTEETCHKKKKILRWLFVVIKKVSSQIAIFFVVFHNNAIYGSSNVFEFLFGTKPLAYNNATISPLSSLFYVYYGLRKHYKKRGL